jgi:predicted outer membrane repeat protein
MLNIDNCLFSNNYAARHGGSILLINSTNVKIYNNTFVNNTSGAGGSGNAIQVSNTTTTSATVKNCIFYNNGPNTYDVTYNGASTLSIENCLGSTLFGTSMSNNLSGNPQFVDFANGNLNLLCTSPAVNMGDATGLTIPSTDLNGDPRTLNTIDMGAYENQTTAISVSANKTVVCAGHYVILRGSCDNLGYTWSNGVNNNVAFYPTATQTYTCTGNGTASTATITIEVVTLANENPSGPTDVCTGSNATINLPNSVNGAQYYLRDNANDYVIDGPVTGTGSAISFTTNPIYATTTYNVVGATNAQLNPIADYCCRF